MLVVLLLAERLDYCQYVLSNRSSSRTARSSATSSLAIGLPVVRTGTEVAQIGFLPVLHYHLLIVNHD